MIMSARIVAVTQTCRKNAISTQICPECYREAHDGDAVFCKYGAFVKIFVILLKCIYI